MKSIMAMTGHKTSQMVRRYIKEANLFKNNALNNLKFENLRSIIVYFKSCILFVNVKLFNSLFEIFSLNRIIFLIALYKFVELSLITILVIASLRYLYY